MTNVIGLEKLRISGRAAVLLYVSVILARRLDGANQTLVELMIQVDHPRKMIKKTAKKMKGLLEASGVHLSYAGYNLFN